MTDRHRPPVVLVYIRDRQCWCGLRSASPGGMLTVCLDHRALENRYAYQEALVLTIDPGQRLPENMCEGCNRHLAVTHVGFATTMKVPRQRSETRDLRRPERTEGSVADVALDDLVSGKHRRPA